MRAFNGLLSACAAVCVLPAFADGQRSPETAAPCRVVTSETAKAWEKTAAAELTEYLAKVATGGRVTVDGRDGIVFHVGDTALAAEKGLDGARLADEEWVIRSFGCDVVLNGGGSRGALYAVYHFLEDDCGVHWWADGDEDVPDAKPLVFGPLDRRGRPALAYREIYRGNTFDKRTSVRNRLNGGACPPEIDFAWGGSKYYGPPSHCHTWNAYVPTNKYMRTHPEWYELRKGERVGGDKAQLCVTAKGLGRHLVARAVEFIAQGEREAVEKNRPKPLLYDLSMNDYYGFCSCEKCTETAAKYGHSGQQLMLLNGVAGCLGKRYPDLFFTTLAYYYAEPPPSNGVRAASNVIVKLCNTDQCVAAGIYENENRPMREKVKAWRNFADNLFVWDYAITYDWSDKYVGGLPFASEFNIAEKFRYYAENGVKGIFLEQEHFEKSDMFELKYFIERKAMEDPTCDGPALVAEFCRLYYGPEAGAKILSARRLLDELREKGGKRIGWYPRLKSFDFLTDTDLATVFKLFDEAAVAVAGNEKLQKRVASARKPFERLKAARESFAREEAAKASEKESK